MKKYLKETAKYLLRCYPIIRPYVKRIDAMYEMSNEDLKKRNEERFLHIFRRAYDKSPFYHRLYSEAGIKKEDITCLDDIKKLPVITKDMVKKHAAEMLTVPKWQVMAGHTSGTTGTPLTVYSSWSSIWWNQAYTYSARLRNGFKYGQPLVSLRGNLDRNTMHMKVHVSNTLYLSSYCINKDTVKAYYDMIIQHQPVAIEGYPSSLYTLALCMKEAGLKLHIPVAFTSSETLLDYQRHLIEMQLGTEIYDNYGMTEQTIYLQEAFNHQGYYELPGYSINEYLEDGEICTSLTNEAFPLIRYRSNDVIEIAELNTDSPQTIVKSIEGRKEDFLICKDGSRVKRLGFIFKGVNHVKYGQLIQENNGFLNVNIVPDQGFTKLDEKTVENNVLGRIGKGNVDFKINLVKEADLVYTKRGKFKFLIHLSSVMGGVIFRVLGRVDDFLICKDGSRVTRVDFVEDGENIKACQWIQKEKGKLLILIVPDDGFTDKDKEFVVDETIKRVGENNMDIEVKLAKLDELRLTKRGKFRLIVNEIPKENNYA
mgnify:FL=1